MGYQRFLAMPETRETARQKFNDDDEAQLSLWMAANLLLFFKPSTQHENPEVLERELIEKNKPASEH